MKNKTVNKKVLRAMSIGLAAMMTVQPILATPVFADDTEPVDDAGSSVEATAESSSAETTTESTSAPAPTVENVSQSYADASNATADIKTSLDQAVSAGRDSNEFAGFDQNNGGELTKLNNAVTGTVNSEVTGTGIGTVDAGTLNANRKEVSDAAIKLVNDAKRDDKKFEVDADELLKGQVNTDINNIVNAEKDLNDAINKQDEAINKIEITNDFTATAGLINLETGKIESATSIPAATESLGAATEYKKDADEKYEQSKADYDKAAADYEAAQDDLKAKQQAYNKALNDAVADDSDLAKAKAELDTAQKDCETLETEISEAQKALSDSAIGKLAAALAKTKENANDWASLDLIMKDVIQYYYFPSIGVPAADVKIDDQFTKNSALADGTKNERANYIKATVKTTDGEKVYYLNYICEKDGTPDNKINNDGRYPKMVIFEKNPELTGHHYVDGKDTVYFSDVVENAENQVTLEFIKDNTSTDSTGKFIIIGETTYHIDDNDDNKEVTKVEAEDIDDVPNTDAGRNGSYISDVKEEKTTTELKDGVLTVKTEGSITTTTFVSGNTLDDIESSKSESSYKDAVDAAKAARDEAVNNALAEGHTLQNDGNGDIISSVTTVSAKASATAKVEYKTKFTTTINLDKNLSVLYDRKDKISKSAEAGEVKAVLDSLINEIKSSLEKEYGDVSVSGNYIIDHDSEYDGFFGWISEAGSDNHYVGKGSVIFTYYSKTTATPEGKASYEGNVTGDFSTDDLLASAKANAVSNAIAASKPSDNSIKEQIDGESRHASEYKEYKWWGKTKYNDAKFKLLDGAVSTKSEVVDTNGGILDASDAKVNSTDVKYDYKVSNITYADQYDTVEDEQTIYSKNLNLSALTSVDDYADTPLLNDNYYNYKNGKSTNGILADLGKTDSEIYQKLMTDVSNANKLAAKYAEAKGKAEEANKKVAAAQEKVNALIESIKALRANSDSEYKSKLKALEDNLAKALENLNEATDEKKAVDAAYKDALAAYEDAVARLTPAPATGDEETAPTAGGGTTTAPAPTLVTTLAGTPVFALPAGGVATPAAGVAGARTSRGAAIDSDSAAADTEDTTAKIAPTKEVEEDALAITKDTIKTIKDNEAPLSSLTEDSTQKMNWWWLLLIALLGATGEEIYRRNKKKKEEEAALKAEIDKE